MLLINNILIGSFISFRGLGGHLGEGFSCIFND